MEVVLVESKGDAGVQIIWPAQKSGTMHSDFWQFLAC